MTASIAAIPLAKAKPDSPLSKLAIAFSKAVRVGLAVREYPYAVFAPASGIT